jgi:hypothetical protein
MLLAMRRASSMVSKHNVRAPQISEAVALAQQAKRKRPQEARPEAVILPNEGRGVARAGARVEKGKLEQASHSNLGLSDLGW